MFIHIKKILINQKSVKLVKLFIIISIKKYALVIIIIINVVG